MADPTIEAEQSSGVFVCKRVGPIGSWAIGKRNLVEEGADEAIGSWFGVAARCDPSFA